MKQLIIKGSISAVLIATTLILTIYSIFISNIFVDTITDIRIIDKTKKVACSHSQSCPGGFHYIIEWEGYSENMDKLQKYKNGYVYFGEFPKIITGDYCGSYNISDLESGEVTVVLLERIILFLILIALSVILPITINTNFHYEEKLEFIKDVKFISSILIFFGYDPIILNRLVKKIDYYKSFNKFSNFMTWLWLEYDKEKSSNIE